MNYLGDFSKLRKRGSQDKSWAESYQDFEKQQATPETVKVREKWRAQNQGRKEVAYNLANIMGRAWHKGDQKKNGHWRSNLLKSS